VAPSRVLRLPPLVRTSRAANQELNAARGHIVALTRDDATPKPLRLAAISVVARIGAEEAREILIDLTDSEDQEIAGAADEAIASVISKADDKERASDWINLSCVELAGL
jgi:HEAT repeat protein